MTTNELDPYLYAIRQLSDPAQETGEVYWAHVRDDGVELRYAAEPSDVPSLKVKVMKMRKRLIEETRTWTIYVPLEDPPPGFEGAASAHRVPPRGEGWVEYDDRADNFTVWRRWHIAEGPKIVTVKREENRAR